MPRTHEPRIRLVRRIPLPNVAGITLPPWGILIERRHDCAGLRSHEQTHWRQYQRLGALRFYAAIVWQYLRHGRNRAPLEVEAVRASGYPPGHPALREET
ncbi:MAG TPA: hypothetical protein ENK19_10030 [Acidobacteria bacterium]|nr:hypothetical protein [Acidobacteriota bacterium]